MEPAAKSDIAGWPNETRALVRAVGIFVGSIVLAGAAFAFAGEIAAAAVSLVGMFGFVGSLFLGARRPSLVVGADGLTIAGRGFVPFADVERVEDDESPYGRTHHLAWLVLKSGERIHLGARLGIFGHRALAVVDEAYAGLNRRITEHRQRERSQHAQELARGDRSVADWIAGVRARATSSGFRDGEIARADLLAVVEDPTAEPSARAAAALALKAGIVEPERVRVRVAAAATAAPNVRVALETVADESASEDRAAAMVSRTAR